MGIIYPWLSSVLGAVGTELFVTRVAFNEMVRLQYLVVLETTE